MNRALCSIPWLLSRFNRLDTYALKHRQHTFANVWKKSYFYHSDGDNTGLEVTYRIIPENLAIPVPYTWVAHASAKNHNI